MERRGQAVDRHGRAGTATDFDHGEAEAEDLRSWREGALVRQPPARPEVARILITLPSP